MKAIIILIAIFFIIVSVVQADSFRCGSRVVSTGDSKADVIVKCGPPDYSEVVSFSVSETSVTKIEAFYYNCGEGRFVHVLTFKGSILVGIKPTGGYGSGPERCE